MTKSFWRYRLARVPLVWWHVTARQMFGREPPRLRAAWPIGTYNAGMTKRHRAMMRYAKR